MGIMRMENTRIIFVIPEKYDNKTNFEQMNTAYQTCEVNANIKMNWVKELTFDINNLKLNDTDFVVFQKFEGKLFEKLKNMKSVRIVGPLAVSICLIEGKPIPNCNYPIFNVAMYDCVVTCSNLPKGLKIDIKAKVELMGGCYVDNLLERNTHLVTGRANSEKYLVAAERGVKLMCASWIEDVWNSSQAVNIHAEDEQFQKHRCLPFHNLVISSTGITNSMEKKQLEKLVNENGGTFSAKLNVSNTDILICSGDMIYSEKYKAAQQNPRLKCVNISWVADSVAKGYALPNNLYQVKKVICTPTAADKAVNPGFSNLSLNSSPSSSPEYDSIYSSLEGNKVHTSKRKAENGYDDLIENLNKKSGRSLGLSLLPENRIVTKEEMETIVDVEEMQHENPLDNFRNDPDDILLVKLMQESNSNIANQIATREFQPLETFTQQEATQNESENNKIFKDIKFILLGFKEDEFEKLKESIIGEGGKILPKRDKNTSDYVVVPTFYGKEIQHTVSEVVNDLFIADCIREEELILNLNYYHRPFSSPVDSKPVHNCVITISGYTGTERAFLKLLIKALGGKAQEQFSRIRQEVKDLFPSTHLLSPEASGKKYQAALKWSLPVVNKDWLFDCAKAGKRVYEAYYLVGNSKAPCRNEDLVENRNSDIEADKTAAIRNNDHDFNEFLKLLPPVNQCTPHRKRFPNSAEKSNQVTPVNKMKQFPQNTDKSTPLSEIKRQLWEQQTNIQEERLVFVETDGGTKPDEKNKKSLTEAEKTAQNQQLANRLQHLEDMLCASVSDKRQRRSFQSTIPVPAGTFEFKDSQACTVGWDYREAEIQPQKVFLLSGILDDVEKARMIEQLQQLGCTVTSSATYDPSCTHLICPKPARNEKSLSCMAAGKWILHSSYLEKSMEVGHLLDEEEFEFGNPKSIRQIPISDEKESKLRMQMMHWWRNEVSRRKCGAFSGMRAIVVSKKQEPIIRVIEAGGGVIVDAKPPFEDRVQATHCLLEPKSITKMEDYIALAKQGIYLVSPIYISDYLQQPQKDVRDCILPFFTEYYDNV